MRVFPNDATPLLNLSVKRADSASDDDRDPDSRPSWSDVRLGNGWPKIETMVQERSATVGRPQRHVAAMEWNGMEWNKYGIRPSSRCLGGSALFHASAYGPATVARYS